MNFNYRMPQTDLARAGVFTAMQVLFLCLAGLFYGRFIAYIVSVVCLYLIYSRIGLRYAWASYGATSIILLILPFYMIKLQYILFFGLYPLIGLTLPDYWNRKNALPVRVGIGILLQFVIGLIWLKAFGWRWLSFLQMPVLLLRGVLIVILFELGMPYLIQFVEREVKRFWR